MPTRSLAKKPVSKLSIVQPTAYIAASSRRSVESVLQSITQQHHKTEGKPR